VRRRRVRALTLEWHIITGGTPGGRGSSRAGVGDRGARLELSLMHRPLLRTPRARHRACEAARNRPLTCDRRAVSQEVDGFEEVGEGRPTPGHPPLKSGHPVLLLVVTVSHERAAPPVFGDDGLAAPPPPAVREKGPVSGPVLGCFVAASAYFTPAALSAARTLAGVSGA
jgi:hypothetical protein